MNAHIGFRLTKKEKQRIKTKAKNHEWSISKFVRKTILDENMTQRLIYDKYDKLVKELKNIRDLIKAGTLKLDKDKVNKQVYELVNNLDLNVNQYIEIAKKIKELKKINKTNKKKRD
jgi:flagellar biosynthesis/type III secretory pathway ATPase